MKYVCPLCTRNWIFRLNVASYFAYYYLQEISGVCICILLMLNFSRNLHISLFFLPLHCTAECILKSIGFFCIMRRMRASEWANEWANMRDPKYKVSVQIITEYVTCKLVYTLAWYVECLFDHWIPCQGACKYPLFTAAWDFHIYERREREK